MDIQHLRQRLAVSDDRVAAKAGELLRLAAVKVPQGTLRQGEVARPAICFELACSMLSCPVDRQAVVRLSGATEKAYAQAVVLMQKLLGVKPKLTARELCIQFGCVRLEATAMRALAQYKQRFVAGLAPAARAAADFSRPVFIAAAFYLTARKAKLKVDRAALLQRHCISAGEFASVTASIADLCFDTLGVEAKRRQPKDIEDGQSGPTGDAGTLDAEEGSDGEGAVHRRPGKRRKHKGYDEWKENVVTSRPKALSLGNLKQATLSFGGAS